MNDKSDFARFPHPTRYKIVDTEGRTWSFLYESASDAAAAAKFLWPDQQQDPDRTGKGWDVQVVGAGQ